MITSSSNRQVKDIIKLQEKRRFRDAQGLFVCEGRRMLEEARVHCREKIRGCYVSEAFYSEMTKADPDYFSGLELELMSDRVFDEIAQTVTPQGVLVVVEKPSHELSSLTGVKNPRLLVLEDIQDPGNLGTMLRTAEAAGMDGILMSKGTVDVYNPKVIRSTMGSVFRMPFVYTDTLEQTLQWLKLCGVRIFAAALGGSIDYRTADYSGGCAIMIGNEGNGLSERIQELADCRVRIPMCGQVESLNASVAAAVLMFEITRRC